MTKKLNEQGFHLIAVVIVILVVGVIGFAGWRVASESKQRNNNQSTNDGSGQRSVDSDSKGPKGSASSIVWMWGGDKWLVQGGQASSCKTKPEFQMPVDINKVTSVLYPGQKRSTGYKSHGGFLFGNTSSESVDVSIPVDSSLTKASRYIEQSQVQYFMIFTNSCGYAYRFDHLRTLTPKFQEIMNKLPEPQVDDSRTTSIEPAISLKAGEKVATGVGFNNNTAMDFGVYDLHQQNEASKNPSYASKHADEKEFTYYGTCFFSYFSSDIESKLRALPAADQMAGKTSDYCK